MPLLKGRDRNVVSENIRELRNNGYAEDEAIAIALSKSREDEPGPEDDKTPVPAGHIRDKSGRVRPRTAFDPPEDGSRKVSDEVVAYAESEDVASDVKAKAKVRNAPATRKPAEKKDVLKPFKGAKNTTHTSPR
jgi:hypothetical protein